MAKLFIFTFALILTTAVALRAYTASEVDNALMFDSVPPAPTPPPPKCKYNTSEDCMGDECCNWYVNPERVLKGQK